MKNITRILSVFLLSLSLGVADGFAASSQPDNGELIENAMPQPTVKVLGGAVEIENPTDEPVEFAVVAITGSTVCSQVVQPFSYERVELSSGYYIVKVGKLSKRVAVR